MTKYHLNTSIYCLLLGLFICAFCNGQSKTPLQTGNITQSATTPKGTLKLIKTQGSTTSDNVKCGLQDKAGNLWFGTTGEGVYRYDGKLFTQFTSKDGLSSNCVYSILEDNLGNIWFGTLDGLCRFDGKKITKIPMPINAFSTSNTDYYYTSQSKKSTVWSMLQDKTGKIWVGTGAGVYCYNGQSFTHFLQNDGVINKQNLQLKMVDCMLEDNNGNIWFASGMPPGLEGVCRYDGKSITSFKPNGDSWVRYISKDIKGNLWFGGRLHGNFIYDGKAFTNFTEKVGIGNSILADKLGNIWFSGEELDNGVESKNGIWCYDGKSFKNYATKDGMGNYFTWCMIEDRKGNIWIGTRNTGLYKYDGKTFTSFSE